MELDLINRSIAPLRSWLTPLLLALTLGLLTACEPTGGGGQDEDGDGQTSQTPGTGAADGTDADGTGTPGAAATQPAGTDPNGTASGQPGQNGEGQADGDEQAQGDGPPPLPGNEFTDPQPPAMSTDEIHSMLNEVAEETLNQADLALTTAVDPTRIERIKAAAAATKIAQARVSVERGDAEQAIGRLAGFDTDYADQPEMVRVALGTELEALVLTQQFDRANTTAKRMMDEHPNYSAAIIDRVLDKIESEINGLDERLAEPVMADRVRNELRQLRQAYAQSAESLARLLMDWAVNNGYQGEQLVPFKIALASAARLTQQYDDARLLLEEVSEMEQFANDSAVLHTLAETYYAQGVAENNDESLIEAAKLYDRLIGGLSQNEDGSYPEEWWNAWMRRLQINDRLGQYTEDIPFRVRQLRFTGGESLGGEPYRSTLTRLQNKYQ